MQALSRALNRLKAGGMVLLVDDEDRENEGDLTLAAEATTPEAIAFMATHGRGLICLALPAARIEAPRSAASSSAWVDSQSSRSM